jgi:hypothetical protein
LDLVASRASNDSSFFFVDAFFFEATKALFRYHELFPSNCLDFLSLRALTNSLKAWC